MKPELKVKNKYSENLDKLKGLVKLVVGNSPLQGYSEHSYIDEEKIISVEPRKRNVRICVYYRTGRRARERHAVPYSALEK